MKLTLTITGTKPMLQCNGRLANPLDQYTQALAALTRKTKKTDGDRVDIMQIEARGACWETSEGLIGLPAVALWRSIFDAAKAFKRGEDIKRSLVTEDTVEPMIIDGRQWACDEYLADADHIFYRSVVIARRRVMRARPLLHNWQVTHHFELHEDQVDPRDLFPIFERAGRLIGVGNWRPTYGTFTVDVA